MKDLESPEQRSLEREMLRVARDEAKRGERDYLHIAIAMVLFMLAIVMYGVGYPGIALLVILGFVAEMAAWIFLFERNRPFPKVEDPPVSAALEKSGGNRKDAV